MPTSCISMALRLASVRTLPKGTGHFPQFIKVISEDSPDHFRLNSVVEEIETELTVEGAL